MGLPVPDRGERAALHRQPARPRLHALHAPPGASRRASRSSTTTRRPSSSPTARPSPAPPGSSRATGEDGGSSAGATVLATGGCAFFERILGGTGPDRRRPPDGGGGRAPRCRAWSSPASTRSRRTTPRSTRGCRSAGRPSTTPTGAAPRRRGRAGGERHRPGEKDVARALIGGPVYARLDMAEPALQAWLRQGQPNCFLPYDRARHRSLHATSSASRCAPRARCAAPAASASPARTAPPRCRASMRPATRPRRENVAGATSGGGRSTRPGRCRAAGGPARAPPASRAGAAARRAFRAVSRRLGDRRPAARPSARAPIDTARGGGGGPRRGHPARQELLPRRRAARGEPRAARRALARACRRISRGEGTGRLRAREAAAVAAAARWSLAAALARTESRGMHRRTDLPARDDALELEPARQRRSTTITRPPRPRRPNARSAHHDRDRLRGRAASAATSAIEVCPANVFDRDADGAAGHRPAGRLPDLLPLRDLLPDRRALRVADRRPARREVDADELDRARSSSAAMPARSAGAAAAPAEPRTTRPATSAWRRSEHGYGATWTASSSPTSRRPSSSSPASAITVDGRGTDRVHGARRRRPRDPQGRVHHAGRPERQRQVGAARHHRRPDRGLRRRVPSSTATGSPKPDPKIAYVFQQYALFPWRTALENIEYALEVRGVAAAERRRKARHFLGLFGLGGFEDRYPDAALRRHAAARGDRPRARRPTPKCC